jgi:hypothetical protein
MVDRPVYIHLNRAVMPEDYTDAQREILALTEGRALVRRLLVDVIGWKVVHQGPGSAFGTPPVGNQRIMPELLTHGVVFGDVLDAMSRRGWWANLTTPFSPADGTCWVGFTPHGVTGWNGSPDHKVGDATLALAVCKAALLALLPAPTDGGERP